MAGMIALAFFKTLDDLSFSRTFSMSRKRRFLGETSDSIRSTGAAAVVIIFFDRAFSRSWDVIAATLDRVETFFLHWILH